MLLDYKIFLILGISDQRPLITLIADVWATPEYDSIHGQGAPFPASRIYATSVHSTTPGNFKLRALR